MKFGFINLKLIPNICYLETSSSVPYVAAIADYGGVDADFVDAEWRRKAVKNNEMFEMVTVCAIKLPESSVSSAAFGSLN